MAGAAINKQVGLDAYQSVMGGYEVPGTGGALVGTGSADLNYNMAVSDYYKDIEDEYWGMLTTYEESL